MLQYIRRLKITPGGSEKQTETKRPKITYKVSFFILRNLR